MTCKDCIHNSICDTLRPIEYCMDKTCSCYMDKSEMKPVIYGEWKVVQGEIGNPFNNEVYDTIDLFVCSNCGEHFDVSEARNYCPNCGARMTKEDIC